MKREIELTVNGQRYELEVRPNRTLLEVLRNELGLKGVRESCGMGVCGCCTVLLDGRAASSCLTLAVQAHKKKVLTIEGLADGDRLHPLQEAFMEMGAVQCGFCTPGMILGAKSMLDENPRPSLEEIRSWMSGNICRCTGYVKIVKAIQVAAERMGSMP